MSFKYHNWLSCTFFILFDNQGVFLPRTFFSIWGAWLSATCKKHVLKFNHALLTSWHSLIWWQIFIKTCSTILAVVSAFYRSWFKLQWVQLSNKSRHVMITECWLDHLDWGNILWLKSFTKACLANNLLQNILPSVLYGIVVSGSCSQSLLDDIDCIYLRATKIIYSLPKDIHNAEDRNLPLWNPIIQFYIKRLLTISFNIFNYTCIYPLRGLIVNSRVNYNFSRLWVVPHFSSGIVERVKRERAWKSPQARKGDVSVVVRDWFWSVKFVSPSKSIKRIQWDSFPHWAVIALVIGKLRGIFIASKRKPRY